MVGVLENTSLEIAGLSLEFWGSLGELLTETAAGGRGPRSPALEQYVRRACEVAIFRSRYPSPPSQSGEGGGGGSGGMNEDDLHELDEFREKVKEGVRGETDGGLFWFWFWFWFLVVFGFGSWL